MVSDPIFWLARVQRALWFETHVAGEPDPETFSTCTAQGTYELELRRLNGQHTGLGPKVPRVSVGSKLVSHSSFAAVELFRPDSH
eukprot:4830221-Prymnesium_polylepis.1